MTYESCTEWGLMIIMTVCCEQPGYSTTPTINDRVSFLFLIFKTKVMGLFLKIKFVLLSTREIKKPRLAGPSLTAVRITS
jgi:hypothetical protein